MGRSFLSRLLVSFGLLSLGCRAQVTVSVSATASHSIPTTLFGLMFEDISHSGDGGLYGELLQNRAFQQVTPNTSGALNAWKSLTSTPITVVADSAPVSSALPNSLQIVIPSGSTSAVSFANSGFFGIKVVPQTYAASLFFKFPTAVTTASSASKFDLTISLISSTNQTLASSKTTVSSTQKTWKQIKVTLKPTKSASDTQNLFVVSIKPQKSTSASVPVNFAMFSLFPPTFKNRENGMRADIAEALNEMKPGFWRFPGGNNLEGQIVSQRWQWNATVGSLLDRPGRQGDWGYANTDGLGLLEYLVWSEDLGMEPIMAVWDGYALGGASVTGDALAPYIQQAIDQINFVIGDPAKSAPAALRASLGRTEPFKLHYVEVGNEDFIGNAPSTVPDRWQRFVTNLTATFPQLRFLATSNVGSPVLTPKPQSWDIHQYNTPKFFASNSFMYDSFARDGTTYFEGEYAAISTNSSNIFGSPDQGRMLWPTVQGSVGEATFMTGLERNADIVFAASYAPLLGHVNSSAWTPNLVGFDAGQVVLSTSYFVQKLFSINKGDAYLPSTLPASNGTLFWSVVKTNSTKEVIIKITNNAATAAPITFSLPSAFQVASQGAITTLTGGATDSNTPDQPTLIEPTTSKIKTGTTFNFTAPAISFSVIVVSAKGV